MDPDHGDVTVLLAELTRGNEEAASRLIPQQSGELVKLDQALDRLAQFDPRQAKIVELRFFGGLTVEETSEVMGISPKTVKRDWSVAKAWLHGELRQTNAETAGELGRN